MTLLTALLRSATLAFLVGYTLAVSPLGMFWIGPATPQGLVPVPVAEKLFVAAWLAIGWIALETVVAWTRVWLGARARRRAALAAAASSVGPPPP